MSLPPNRRFCRWLAAFCSLLCASAWADEFVTIDFPIRGEKVASQGLSAPPRQVSTPDGLGYAEVLLRPIRKTDHIFLTFIFEEDGGKGPAIFWKGDVSGNQVTITDNLAEGVVGWNRRTIELPEELAKEAGRLYVMGRQDRLRRMRIDWCEPLTSFVSADQERPQFVMGGSMKLDRDLTGQAVMTPPDVWFGRVLDASLQDGVADISQTTELVAPLKGVAGEARLRAKFLGLPLGKSVRVWVNGKPAGRIQPVLPSLTDPGYLRRGGKRSVYAGWREGSIFLEPGTLKDGDNSIMFIGAGPGVYLSGAALEIQSSVEEVDPEQKDLKEEGVLIEKDDSASEAEKSDPKPEDSAPAFDSAETPPEASPTATPAPSPAPKPSPASTPAWAPEEIRYPS